MRQLGAVLPMAFPALVVLLVVAFRKKRAVRTLAVIVLTATLVSVVHFGLRLAARNVQLPSREQLKQHAEYGDAWNAGRLATQKNVDAYQLTLLASILALGMLALIPSEPRHRDHVATFGGTRGSERKLFVVQHVHRLSDNHEDVKFIGIYSSRESAEGAARRLTTRPGFRGAPGCFHIDEYVLDQDYWRDGYKTV